MASSTVLTDGELRRRLLAYGENYPVTASNRRILIGKLTKLDGDASKRSTRNKSSRSTLLSFSSSDDSDHSAGSSDAVNDSFSTPTSNVPKTRRRSSVSTNNNRESNSGPNSRTPSSGLRPPGDKHRLAPQSRTTRSMRSSTATSNIASSSTTSRRSLPVSSSRSTNLDISDSDVSDSSMTNIPENRDVNEFPRSRRSMYADWGPSTQPSSVRCQQNAQSTLSSSSSTGLRWSTSPRAINGNHDPISGDSVMSADRIKAESGANHANSSQCVSMVLLAVVSIFFLVVGIIYLGARHKDLMPYLAIDSRNVNMSPICKPDSEENCVVADVASSLKDILRSLAGEAECNFRSGNQISRRMPLKEAERQMNLLAGTEKMHMSDVLLMFSKNPLWGVRLLRDDGTAVPSNELSRVRWLESAISNVPLLCRLKLAFLNTIFKSAIILAVILVLMLVGYASYLYLEWKRKEREEVFALVEKILDILQDHARVCQGDTKLTPYLAIPHVRDMLTPPSERRSGRRIWDMAVRFIENNESRVRFEMQSVEGEDFQVWRWLQPDSCSPSNKIGNKSQRMWQGQAFETLESGMNALPFSPTPCLKVRNMFDPAVEDEDDWPLHIQDAILEKCIEADIIHLKVDPTSNEGCVYIKCKDSATAGKVYRDLHGWWFDGKLVTVKYLRLERYHERFPEAADCFRFLRPNAVVSPGRMRRRSAMFVSTPS